MKITSRVTNFSFFKSLLNLCTLGRDIQTAIHSFKDLLFRVLIISTGTQYLKKAMNTNSIIKSWNLQAIIFQNFLSEPLLEIEGKPFLPSFLKKKISAQLFTISKLTHTHTHIYIYIYMECVQLSDRYANVGFNAPTHISKDGCRYTYTQSPVSCQLMGCILERYVTGQKWKLTARSIYWERKWSWSLSIFNQSLNQFYHIMTD